MPWAVTVALPRFAGAVGWLVVLALLMTMRVPEGELRTAAVLGSVVGWVEAVVAATLYPSQMVGQQVTGSPGVLLVAASTIALLSMVVALAWIRDRDIPLEASQ
jgi:hypothetical protein